MNTEPNRPASAITPDAARAIHEGRHGDPFAVLGPHEVDGVRHVACFDAGAETMAARDGEGEYPLARVDDTGVFQGAVPGDGHYWLSGRAGDDSWEYEDAEGNRLGQRVTPLERVGLYVPGGKAAYPSSVLMTAIPAKVAGVDELVMVVPTPSGAVNPLVLAAAALAEVDRVFTIGGAQAVAALAFGTATVPAVDKIVGPGNIYVAVAKRLVFGRVGIDMIAGPSEVVVVCDATADAQWVAADLFAQAEHDEIAQSIMITPDPDMLAAVRRAIDDLLPQMERSEIIRASLENHGALIRVRELREAAAITNRIAPEHLELLVEQPRALVEEIRHAGAIFLGAHSAESLGDYCAGPNHVLPTSGTARFSSPLGVYDFQKRSSIVMCSPEGAARIAGTAAVLARAEGLGAHARSAELRLPGEAK